MGVASYFIVNKVVNKTYNYIGKALLVIGYLDDKSGSQINVKKGNTLLVIGYLDEKCGSHFLDQCKTRMLQLQATVKRFQFDLYVNLEGQHMLISSWSQK